MRGSQNYYYIMVLFGIRFELPMPMMNPFQSYRLSFRKTWLMVEGRDIRLLGIFFEEPEGLEDFNDFNGPFWSLP